MSDASSLPLPVFKPEERVCGNCKLWSPHSVDHRGWVGPCRIYPGRGLFPPSAPLCDKFAPRGGVTVPEAAPAARARAARSVAPVVRRKSDPNEIVELGDLNMTREELMEIFREAAGETEAPPLAGKWEGGTLRLIPGNAELQAKDLPIDNLFHKVVMVRDRLRTLEQKINGHSKLTDAEKVEMQSYITRVYGSLTSFNILFREKGDQFVGQKGEE
ncbi:high-potential iron-sulfur protein [Hyalangium versicolor]|uniref:high-potential iron-sulfur protein n=1 Tax=Hyalangium versicolor TaxID=2861190 RepID=UPI001CCD9053|nr:high-potential iron-sulfur protein [Hyalangium versicolor]